MKNYLMIICILCNALHMANCQNQKWGSLTIKDNTHVDLFLNSSSNLNYLNTALNQSINGSDINYMYLINNLKLVGDAETALNYSTLFQTYLKIGNLDLNLPKYRAIKPTETPTSGVFADHDNKFYIRLPFNGGLDDINNNKLLGGTTFFTRGIQDPSLRRKLWKEVFMSAIIESEILSTDLIDPTNTTNYKENAINKILRINNLVSTAQKTTSNANAIAEMLKAGAIITVQQGYGDGTTSLDEYFECFQEIADNDKVFEVINKLSFALKGISIGTKINSEILKTFLLKSLQTAEADHRLEILNEWIYSASPGYNDTEIVNGFEDAKYEYNFIREESFIALGYSIIEALKQPSLLLENSEIFFSIISKYLMNQIGLKGIKLACTNSIFASATALINLVNEVDEEYDILRLASLSATLEDYISSYLFNNFSNINSSEIEIDFKSTLAQINSFLGYYYFSQIKEGYDTKWYSWITNFNMTLLTSIFNDAGTSKEMLIKYCDDGVKRNIDFFKQYCHPFSCAKNESNWFNELINNSYKIRSTLSNGTVSTTSGTVNDTYAFNVIFKSITGEIPEYVHVIINGKSYPMALEGNPNISDWINGVTYSCIAAFTEGTYKYHFEGSAGGVRLDNYPAIGDLSFKVGTPAAGIISLSITPNPANKELPALIKAHTDVANCPIGFYAQNTEFGSFSASNPIYTDINGNATVYYTPYNLGSTNITAVDWNNKSNFTQKTIFSTTPKYNLEIGIATKRKEVLNNVVTYDIEFTITEEGEPFNNHEVKLETDFGNWANGQKVYTIPDCNYKNDAYLYCTENGIANIEITVEGNTVTVKIPIQLTLPPLTAFRSLPYADIQGFSICPNDDKIAFSTNDNHVRIYDVSDDVITKDFGPEIGSYNRTVYQIKYSPDGNRLFLMGNSITRIIDATTGSLIAANPNISTGSLYRGDARWLDNNTLFVGYGSPTFGGNLLIVNASNLSVVNTLLNSSYYYPTIDVTANYALVSFSTNPVDGENYTEGHSFLFNRSNWANIWGDFNPEGNGKHYASCLSPDETEAAIFDSYSNSQLYFQKTSNNSPSRQSISASKQTSDLDWNPVNKNYIAGLGLSDLKLWNLQTGAVEGIDNSIANNEYGNEVFWFPNGELLAAKSSGTIRLYAPFDLTTPTILISSPINNFITNNSTIKLKGNVSDDRGILKVRYRINNLDWKSLTITNGSFDNDITLAEGENLIEVSAMDVNYKETQIQIKGNFQLLLAPTIPVLLSPENNTSNQPTSQTFKWSLSDRAENYNFQLGLDENFNTIIVNDPLIAETSFTVNSLSRNTKYYWRVRANNKTVYSLFQEPYSFTTVIPAPNIPLILFPENNASITGANVYFGWNVSYGASEYRLQISENENFNSIYLEKVINDNENLVENLEIGKTYYWRLSAKNIGGESSWSEIRRFTTKLPRPVLISPLSNGSIFPVDIMFNWSTVLEATSYSLQVSEDQEFSSLIINQNNIPENSFTAEGLKLNKYYYWRVKASKGLNSSDWSFFNSFNTNIPNAIEDIDNNVYKTVKIGSQWWMAENLKSIKFNDGSAIPKIEDGITWSNLKNPAYCWYNNESANKTMYGALYNWWVFDKTINENRNVCPLGWHVPNDAEWTILTDYIGGNDVAGSKLKSSSGWIYSDNGTNEYGYSALPGGRRLENQIGEFNGIQGLGFWWTSTEDTYPYVWRASARWMGNDNSVGVSNEIWKNSGLSVRCVKDEIPDPPVIKEIIQPRCALETGSVTLSALPKSGTWTLTRTPDNVILTGKESTATVSSLSPGTYTFTVTNTAGFKSLPSESVIIKPESETPQAITALLWDAPTCSNPKGTVYLTKFPTENWTLTRNPGGIITHGTESELFLDLDPGTYSFTIANEAGCVSPAKSINVPAVPETPQAPHILKTTHPSCLVPTGSVDFDNLPGHTNWYYIYEKDGTSGKILDLSSEVKGLSPGFYNFYIKVPEGCTSAATPVEIDPGHEHPATPLIDRITQPSCSKEKGDVDLLGLPSGTWTITASPGGLKKNGSGIFTTFNDLPSGTYTFKVQNSDGCESESSSIATIESAPVVPSTPVIGSIKQPDCSKSTGSVSLSGLPASCTWTVSGSPGNIIQSGTGTNLLITDLTDGTYNFTVSNGSCTSVPSDDAIIIAQPVKPTIPDQTIYVLSGNPYTLVPPQAPTGTTYTWPLPTYTGGVSGGTAQSDPQNSIHGTLSIPSGSGKAVYTVTPQLGLCTGNDFTVTVNVSSICVPVSIETQPTGKTICPSGNVSLEVSTTGTLPVYQWQYYNAGSWINVTNNIPAGALYTNGNNSTLHISGLSNSGAYQFRCKISNCANSEVTSNSATVTVAQKPNAPSISDLLHPGCSVSTGSLKLTGLPASGNWIVTKFPGEEKQNGSGTSAPIVGLEPGSYTFTVTNSAGCTSNPSTTATIQPQPDLAAEPTLVVASNTQICSGSSTILSYAGGSGTDFKWYIGACGIDLTGTGNDIVVNPTVTTTYYGRWENSCNQSNCKSVTVTVSNPPVSPTSVSASKTTLCQGSSTTLSYTGGTGEVFKWYAGSCSGTTVGEEDNLVVTPTVTTTYYGRWENSCNQSDCKSVTIIVSAPPVAPTNVSATKTTICQGNSTTLTYNGGAGEIFNWYSGSCGENLVGTGNFLSVTPTITTTYYGRWENGCNDSECKSVTVTVNNQPVTPSTVSASETSICKGNSTTLTFTGGSGDVFKWYEGSCIGTPVGEGINLSVSPTTTTTYYGRWENSCNKSDCKSVTILVASKPVAPTIVIASSAAICLGSSITLTYNGGSGDIFKWYTGSCGGIVVGSGNNLIITPTETTTYYGRWENNCGHSECLQLTVTVNPLPVSPTSLSATSPICQGSSTTLSYIGGSGTNFKWYAGSCGGNPVGEGNNLTVTPSSTTTYYGRWENSCGDSECKLVTVTVNPKPVTPTSVSATSPVCQGSSTTLSYIGGSGTNFKWYAGSCGGNSVGEGNNLVVSPDLTTTYYGRWENDCGYSDCKQLLITVNSIPAKPDTIKGDIEVNENGSKTYVIDPINGATSYTWILAKNWTGKSVSNSIDVTFASSDSVISVIANNSCGSSEAQTLAINVIGTGIKILTSHDIQVYPNPSTDKITVQFAFTHSGKVNIRIMDVYGKALFVREFSGIRENTSESIDMHNFPVGIYNLIISSDDWMKTDKIVKQ